MNSESRGTLMVGTSGIVVPGSKETIPPEFKLKSRLNYYSSLFNTLEVNSIFHKLPMPSTLEKWAQDVSTNFRFTLKLWKEVTHVKQLSFDVENISKFFSVANRIYEKKGCLLIQFPGKITIEFFSQVEKILLQLQELDPGNDWRKAIEFRSPTWYISETYELAKTFGAAIVQHDMPKSKNLIEHAKAHFIYLRFHGPTGDYRGSYSDAFLKEQSVRIRHWLNEGRDVYTYFNNTMGSAFDNAMKLKTLVDNETS